VEVIVATGSLTPYAAKAATTTIPVVITNHGDPVGSGLVASLARPGGNITGLSLLGLELVGKQLELLKEAVPRLMRVGMLSNAASRTHPRMLSEADGPARTLGLRLEPVSVNGADDYDRVFATLAGARADAVLVLGDPIFWRHRARIVGLALKHRLPGMFAQREYVEAGGLMSYGANLRGTFRRAAMYVDRILKGAKPGELPIEQPTTFELVVNSRTARAIGLTIPQAMLARTDRVIE
jgi:putative ABC transport system substrate-binding protein